MRAPERELRRLWRGERGPTPALLAALTAPLAVVFGMVVRTRNLLYDHALLSGRRCSIPIVSVGNLAVGGTGKTPVSAWLARTLSDAGRRPALVTRGYGEDEILLHRRWNPDVPVFRHPRRADGVEAAAAEGCDIAVLDDAFQHRAVGREFDLVLVSPAHPFPPRLLPRGPFRESLAALRRADRILITAKGPHESGAAHALAIDVARIPGLPPVDVFTLEPGPWTMLDGSRKPPPEGPPLVVASIAEPEGFLRVVSDRTGHAPDLLAFSDHHPYHQDDIERIRATAGSRWVATTEKDAVKLLPFRELLPEVRVLPLMAGPREALTAELLQRFGGGRTKREAT